ncbi:MAG: hypothetical protein ACFE0R_13860 [Salinarimonas sp.]
MTESACRDDLRTELRVAAIIARKNGAPNAAAWIEACLSPMTAAELEAVRRATLRKVARTAFPFESRSAAAKAIHGAWVEWRAGGPCPQDLADAFALLAAAGVRPIAWRTIADVLDPDLK